MESREDCAAVWNRMKRMRQIQMWKLCKGMTKAETELLHVMCRLSEKIRIFRFLSCRVSVICRHRPFPD